MQKRRGYIPEFDGMRGIAIILVMLFHLWNYTGGNAIGHAISAVARTGWSGVDVFFVLSGFLITGILLDTRGSKHYWRKFYIRRSLRIFPLYYAVMTAIVLGAIVIKRLGIEIDDPALKTVDRAWINYFYLTNFVKAFYGGDFVPLDIAWSLAVEEQFYLIFPFVVCWTSRRTLKIILIAAIVLAPILRYLSLEWSESFDAPRHMAAYVLPYCRMDTLAMGGLAVLLVRDSSDQVIRVLSIAAWPALIAAGVTLSLWGRPDVQFVVAGYSVVAFASMAIMLRVFSGDRPILGRFFRQPWLVYVGKISYGLYLLHLIARAMIDQLILRGHGQAFRDDLGLALLRFAMVAAVAVIMATVSFYAFERPILRLKNRFAPEQTSVSRPD